jgi:hypothetical protein
MKLFLVAAFLCVAASAFGQENAIALLRQDLKTQKVEIMTASLPLTEKEAKAFWPIYRDYDNELSKLGDRRIASMKKIFENYQKMDEPTAQQLVKESFSITRGRTDLLEKYCKRIAKEVGPLAGARWLQIESEILTLVDAQIMDQMPLVKLGPAKQEQKK